MFAFPFLLALFMLPKLAVVYNQVTLPLQLFASRMAGSILSVAGFSVIRDGVILDVSGHRIEVVEACDGIRYLLPLGFSSLVYGYMSGAKPWIQAVLLAATVPMAILANAVRVAAAGGVPALAEGSLHTLAGWGIFVVCLACLVLMRQWMPAPERHV
jgi:exosortase